MKSIPVIFENINRTAVVIKPKAPFFDWLKSIDPTDTPGDLVINSDIYLLPDYGTEAQIEQWLTKNFDLIFADQLNNWYIDDKLWVQNRTFKMFKEWFDYSLHIMLFDTEQGPIEKI